jgi:hypothetical protein
MSELLKEENLSAADIISPSRQDSVNGFNNDSIAQTDTAARPARGIAEQQPNPLFPASELDNFRSNWSEVQISFVDQPREAVERADHLVAAVFKRIGEQFASEREQMEKQWDRGENVNTEDLRQAFRRYRAFFDRLLSF